MGYHILCVFVPVMVSAILSFHPLWSVMEEFLIRYQSCWSRDKNRIIGMALGVVIVEINTETSSSSLLLDGQQLCFSPKSVASEVAFLH